VDGLVAYQGTLVEGDQRTFTARRAVDLHLGNAGGVQLTVDGRPRGARPLRPDLAGPVQPRVAPGPAAPPKP
jgi:hypothetical protein